MSATTTEASAPQAARRQARRPRVVADIMTTDLLTLYEEDNLERIEEGMKRYGVRHLPVVDDGKLVGLVSHRDVLRVAVSVLDPTRAVREEHQRQVVLVHNIMTRDLVTAGPQTPIVTAAKLLQRHKIGCLPVIEGDDRLVGIVTDADFLGLVIQLLDELPAEPQN